MEARLPQEKLGRLRRSLQNWHSRKAARKREILSLLGLLQHAAKVVRPGRTFMRRMFDTTMKVKELNQVVRLNKEFRGIKKGDAEKGPKTTRLPITQVFFIRFWLSCRTTPVAGTALCYGQHVCWDFWILTL